MLWSAVQQGTEQRREYYRLPEATTQLAKISKLLLAMEKGSLTNLQGKTLEEIEIEAEAGNSFHKKTVTASVDGGVASIAGSITTISDLVLVPFTFGLSLIVTAVGIGVVTTGSVMSVSGNITVTVLLWPDKTSSSVPGCKQSQIVQRTMVPVVLSQWSSETRFLQGICGSSSCPGLS
ncbi:hypothetical protein cypCar_00046370 [Cyprinus carpio]|nr:hypothetical protein cypCar_00046370 [Cyprinus carpio]